MGVKKQHWALPAYDTPISQCWVKAVSSPMLGAIPSPFLNQSLQVLGAAHISPCCSATGLALTPAMCPPQAVLPLGRGLTGTRSTLKPRKPRAPGKTGHQRTGSAEQGELGKPAAKAQQEAPAGEDAASRSM